MRSGVSIVIPAYNEEKNIKISITNAYKAVSEILGSFEMIVVNDGSTDKTGILVEELAKKYKRLKILHHKKNLGLGHAVRNVLPIISFSHVTFFPGDGDMSITSLIDLIKMRDRADFVTSYINYTKNRSFPRMMMSKAFVILMNLLFNSKLKYYNGPLICHVNLLRDTRLTSHGFTIFAEAKVKLIKQGYSYHEIPFYHVGREHGKSKALTIKSILQTIKTVWTLYRET